jgi:hypothetical protein
VHGLGGRVELAAAVPRGAQLDVWLPREAAEPAGAAA